MPPSPLVSVVIPSYNHEKFIAETIRSVFRQDYCNIELIIIDDGSTDNSYSEIQRVVEREKPINITNVIVEKKVNEGLIKTLNYGLSKAKGIYIGQLASDDLYSPSQVSQAVKAFQNESCGLVFANPYFIKDTEKTRSPLIRRDCWLRSILKNKEKTFKELLRKNFLPGSTIFYHSDVFLTCGLMDPFLVNRGEISLHWKIAKQFRFSMLSGNFGYYRIHDKSTWRSLKEDILKLESDYFALLDRFVDWAPETSAIVFKAKKYVSYDYKKSILLAEFKHKNRVIPLINHLLNHPSFLFHDIYKSAYNYFCKSLNRSKVLVASDGINSR